jgi:hypothetical protein
MLTVEYYVADVVMIWQLEDVDTLHVKRMDCSGSHKYSYRGLSKFKSIKR